MVLSIKHGESGDEVKKSRFVIGGHRDIFLIDLVHTAKTVQQSSIRLLLSLAAILGFKVWSNDVSQAYLQASIPLLRDVYIRPDCL
jgi:hypothetical protein